MTLQTKTPTIGSDPELLLLSKSGSPAPASRIISKSSRTKSNLVYDNAAVEMRHKPRTCIEYNLRNLKQPIAKLQAKLGKATERGDPKEVSFSPALRYSKRALQADGCAEFGCDPTMVMVEDGVEPNEPNVTPDSCDVRTAGFHLHVGFVKHSYSSSSIKESIEFAKSMEGAVRTVVLADIFLGLPGVILEAPYAEEARLRRLGVGYGVAGEFRQQPYGFEYRSLGPWPLVHPIWTWWSMSMMRCIWWLVAKDLDKEIADDFDRVDVMRAINESDVDLALELWTRAKGHAIRVHEEDKAKRKSSLGVGGWRRSNDAMHPDLLRRLEFAFAHDGIDTFTCGRDMFSAWKEHRDHTSMCFPAFTGWLLDERDTKGSNIKSSKYRGRKKLISTYEEFTRSWSPKEPIKLAKVA